MAEFIAFLLLSKLRTADSMQPCNTCRNAQIQVCWDEYYIGIYFSLNEYNELTVNYPNLHFV